MVLPTLLRRHASTFVVGRLYQLISSLQDDWLMRHSSIDLRALLELCLTGEDPVSLQIHDDIETEEH